MSKILINRLPGGFVAGPNFDNAVDLSACNEQELADSLEKACASHSIVYLTGFDCQKSARILLATIKKNPEKLFIRVITANNRVNSVNFDDRVNYSPLKMSDFRKMFKLS